jgi:hypothetical protein
MYWRSMPHFDLEDITERRATTPATQSRDANNRFAATSSAMPTRNSVCSPVSEFLKLSLRQARDKAMTIMTSAKSIGD